jgi:glycosyltransferase involved in cell wall biosynthesis
MEEICICVCAAGQAKFLKKCLDSLARQIFSCQINVHIAVIGDGLQRDSLSTVNEFIAAGPYKVTYAIPGDLGVSSVRHAALNIAYNSHADWIVFIDADQIADPHWIERIYRQHSGDLRMAV